jgi:branched-subunit amino acid transport protein
VNYPYILAAIFIMAGVTYFVRMLPLVLFRKEIRNPLVKSFLYYVPYGVLAARTSRKYSTPPGISGQLWADLYAH